MDHRLKADDDGGGVDALTHAFSFPRAIPPRVLVSFHHSFPVRPSAVHGLLSPPLLRGEGFALAPQDEVAGVAGAPLVAASRALEHGPPIPLFARRFLSSPLPSPPHAAAIVGQNPAPRCPHSQTLP